MAAPLQESSDEEVLYGPPTLSQHRASMAQLRALAPELPPGFQHVSPEEEPPAPPAQEAAPAGHLDAVTGGEIQKLIV